MLLPLGPYFYVSPTGQVGFGTTMPKEKLDLVGNLKIIGGGNGIVFSDETRQTTAVIGGGVPPGFSILGDTPNAPPGYSPAGVLNTADVWTYQSSELPESLSSHAAASTNQKVYVLGGYLWGQSPYVPLDTVYEYSPDAGTWSIKAAMPTPRAYLTAVTVENRIYAIGGYGVSHDDVLGTVEMYDPETNTWASREPMPTPRFGLAAAVANGKIYVFGGMRFGASLATLEEYDPETDSWAVKASMPRPVVYHGGASVNGKIYSIGGGSDIGVPPVWEYDPMINSWTTKSNMITPRYALAVAMVNNLVYAIGGVKYVAGGDSYSSIVEAYDPHTDLWVSKASMQNVAYEFAATTLGDKIYALGGDGVPSPKACQEYSPMSKFYVHRKN